MIQSDTISYLQHLDKGNTNEQLIMLPDHFFHETVSIALISSETSINDHIQTCSDLDESVKQVIKHINN